MHISICNTTLLGVYRNERMTQTEIEYFHTLIMMYRKIRTFLYYVIVWSTLPMKRWTKGTPTQHTRITILRFIILILIFLLSYFHLSVVGVLFLSCCIHITALVVGYYLAVMFIGTNVFVTNFYYATKIKTQQKVDNCKDFLYMLDI